MGTALFFVLFIVFLILFMKKNKEAKNLTETIQSTDSEYQQKKKEIDLLKDQIEQYTHEVEDYLKDSTILAAETFVPDKFKSEEYQSKLSICKVNQKDCIKNDMAVKEIYGTANSPATKKAKNDNKKQILRCFNAECEAIFYQITASNVDTKRNALQKAYESINKIFEIDGFNISQKYFELKLEEFNLYYAYQKQLAIEKDFQKAAREQMLEEQKVIREIEQAKKKIEKEEKQFNNEIHKLMQYMQSATDIEKQLYIDKIKELEEKLKLVEKDKENVLQREQNTRAGYVYIISNIGSFGENIYKIGMTRRLEPMDRVNELGDASVPFKFDVHAMIFSEDAPELENILHKHFQDRQLNKINTRKEFFNVSIDEIEKVVKDNYNATVNFIKIPPAEEYRESLQMQ